MKIFFLPVIFLIATFAACTKTKHVSETSDGPPLTPFDINQVADPIPWNEPKSLGGNPQSYVVFGQRYHVLSENRDFIQRGIASWYGRKFHGRKTSNGETFDMFAISAAHKTLPLPTFLRVTNLENNNSIVVRVNDRGPFHQNRIIDLSYAAAMKLGIHIKGTGFVEIEAITEEQESQPPQNVNQRSSANTIFLQVGAFTDKQNAVRLHNRVNLPHLPASRIDEGMHQTKQVFRVQMGPIVSVDEVDKLTAHLSKLGITNSQLIVEKAVEIKYVIE